MELAIRESQRDRDDNRSLDEENVASQAMATNVFKEYTPHNYPYFPDVNFTNSYVSGTPAPPAMYFPTAVNNPFVYNTNNAHAGYSPEYSHTAQTNPELGELAEENRLSVLASMATHLLSK